MTPEPRKIGRYDVGYALGRGSMGVVYLATDPLLKRSVAVKTMKEKSGNAAETIERFKREAEISAQLNHPNIITVYDVGVDPEWGPFLTMEYISGASLAHIIRMELPADEILRLLLQAMSALQAAQLAGFVHRDVKPENMLVSQTGVLKLMDFGLARGDHSRLTAEGMLFGTPSYTAPELLTGSSPSPATDRYAFAVTAFEALTCALPYQASSVGSTLYRIVHEPPTIPPDLDPELKAVFLKALDKDPAERYPSLPLFMEALIRAVPLDPEQRSKLLDSLDAANTSTSPFIFLPASSDAIPALAQAPAESSPEAATTTRTDPRAHQSAPDPPTYPLRLNPTPEPISADTVALAQVSQETHAETDGSAVPAAAPTLPMIPPGRPGKRGPGLRRAALVILLLGGLGAGGYFSRGFWQPSRSIQVLSEPAGATVYLGEQKLGETPLEQVELKGRGPVLRFKLEGYLSQSRTVQPDESTVKAVLKKPPHVLSILTDPPGAQVFLNGEPVGWSPIRNLGIPAEGPSHLKIIHENYIPWEAEVDAGIPFPELIRLSPLPKQRGR
ncbi:MAG: protein kinase [Holophagaceae bacterium]|nr:protein kinase [Holophagaceae bacterium]